MPRKISPTGSHGMVLTAAVRDPVVAEVALKHGVFPSEIMRTGTRQRRVISRARHEVMWRLRGILADDRRPKYSFPTIARSLNLRDHTSVMWGCDRHEERMAECG